MSSEQQLEEEIKKLLEENKRLQDISLKKVRKISQIQTEINKYEKKKESIQNMKRKKALLITKYQQQIKDFDSDLNNINVSMNKLMEELVLAIAREQAEENKTVLGLEQQKKIY